MTPNEYVKRLCELLGPGYGIYNAKMSPLTTCFGKGDVFSFSVVHKGKTQDVIETEPLEERTVVKAVSNIRRSFGYLVHSSMAKAYYEGRYALGGIPYYDEATGKTTFNPE